MKTEILNSDLRSPLTEGKRRAGMGKPFVVGVSACVLGGDTGELKPPASGGSCSPEELRSPSVSQSAVSTKDVSN